MFSESTMELLDLVKTNEQHRATVEMWRDCFETVVLDDLWLSRLTTDTRAQGHVRKSEGLYQEIINGYVESLDPELQEAVEMILGDKLNTLWVYFSLLCATGNTSIALWCSKYEQNCDAEYGDLTPQTYDYNLTVLGPAVVSLTKHVIIQGQMIFEAGQIE